MKTCLRGALKTAGKKSVMIPFVTGFVYGNVPMNIVARCWMKPSLPLLLFVFLMDARGI